MECDFSLLAKLKQLHVAHGYTIVSFFYRTIFGAISYIFSLYVCLFMSSFPSRNWICSIFVLFCQFRLFWLLSFKKRHWAFIEIGFFALIFGQFDLKKTHLITTIFACIQKNVPAQAILQQLQINFTIVLQLQYSFCDRISLESQLFSFIPQNIYLLSENSIILPRGINIVQILKRNSSTQFCKRNSNCFVFEFKIDQKRSCSCCYYCTALFFKLNLIHPLIG